MSGNVLYVGDQNGPVVWSVDDAWFDDVDRGAGYRQSAVVRSILGIEGKTLWLGFVKVKALLEQEEERLKRLGRHQEYFLTGDMQSFLSLLACCEEKGVGIVFCDFDFLESNFTKCNRRGVGLLLDVADARTGRQRYGIDLLQRLLNGSRFRGEVFFWTSRATEVTAAIRENSGDPAWWPIRFVPRVGKGESQAEIESFVDYFTQGIESDIIVELARSAEGIIREGKDHPHSDEEIPEWAFRANLFKEAEGGVASFKALYRYDSGGARSRGRRMSVALLRELFAEDGIELTGETAQVTLPVQPGVLFVIHVITFLRCLGDQREIDLVVSRASGLERTQLWIGLDDSKLFEAAWWQRPDRGTAVRAFRDLIGAAPSIRDRYGRPLFPEDMVAGWSVNAFLKNDHDESSLVLNPVVRPRFQHHGRDRGGVWLEWEYRVGNVG